MDERPERRRTPRVEMRTEEVVRLERRQRVQLLDISQSGTLLGCETALPVEAQGQLRAGLATQPFSAQVTVKRVQAKPSAGGQVRVGMAFGSMDDRSRQHLDQFLRRGKD